MLVGCDKHDYVDVEFKVWNKTEKTVTLSVTGRSGSHSVTLAAGDKGTLAREKGSYGIYMLDYLFELLRPASVQAAPRDDRYVVFTVTPQRQPSELDALLMRQIVRDHGEATHRRACGITVDNNIITIILPRYNGQV